MSSFKASIRNSARHWKKLCGLTKGSALLGDVGVEASGVVSRFKLLALAWLATSPSINRIEKNDKRSNMVNLKFNKDSTLAC